MAGHNYTTQKLNTPSLSSWSLVFDQEGSSIMTPSRANAASLTCCSTTMFPSLTQQEAHRLMCTCMHPCPFLTPPTWSRCPHTHYNCPRRGDWGLGSGETEHRCRCGLPQPRQITKWFCPHLLSAHLIGQTTFNDGTIISEDTLQFPPGVQHKHNLCQHQATHSSFFIFIQLWEHNCWLVPQSPLLSGDNSIISTTILPLPPKTHAYIHTYHLPSAFPWCSSWTYVLLGGLAKQDIPRQDTEMWEDTKEGQASPINPEANLNPLANKPSDPILSNSIILSNLRWFKS